MTYQEISPNLWTYEKDGDFVEGIVVAKEDNVGKNNAWLYSIDTPEGIKNVWGSTILDSKMAFIQVEDKIKITYLGLGEAKSGRNAPKLFKVEKDK